MICNRPFLVTAGPISNQEIEFGSISLSNAWGGTLNKYSCSDSPRTVLEGLHESKSKGMVQLLGDAAVQHQEGGSWLEALAAWRKPAIVLANTSPSGEITGYAPAYAALCETLSVPLLGIIQVGGYWDSFKRRLDGLPWCGWIASEKTSLNEFMTIEEVVIVLSTRNLTLNY